jgi:osmoprotectant transport system ATP-binding protein
VIRQIDTPERILALPADDFVDDFIGAGSTLKGLHFERVSGLTLAPYPTMTYADSVEAGQKTLADSKREWLLLLDDQGNPSRWLRHGDLRRGRVGRDLIPHGQQVRSFVEQNATLHDTLEEMLKSSTAMACVIDPRGHFEGIVEIGQLTAVIRNLRAEAQAHYDQLAASS